MSRLVTVAVVLALASIVHAAPGDLDPTFGTGGKVVGSSFAYPGAMVIRDGVIQPDGRIVIVGDGFALGTGAMITIARLESDGSVDASFGNGGAVTVLLGGSGYDMARAVEVEPDGRILVAGQIDTTPGSYATGDAFVLRLLGDGTLDPSFGNGGTLIVSFGLEMDDATAVMRQPNGKIVIAGESVIGTSWRFALARYEEDGTPDLTFGTLGRVVATIRGSDDIKAAVLQPDGKIVVAGGSRPPGGPTDAAFARYNPDGTLDGTFGTGGVTIVHATSGSDLIDVALQPDGKVVGVGGGANVSGYLALALRLGANGALDPSFGTDGAVVLNAPQPPSFQSVIVQPNGQIAASGWRYYYSGSDTQDFLTARLDANGALDAAFGAGGFVVTNMGSDDAATTLRRQTDGKLVAMGHEHGDVALARYEGTPAACGNGVTEPPEECDDGNLTAGDGCDTGCAVESGFGCSGTPSTCTAGCGDGSIAGAEQCDDGNLVADDGCDATCRLEPGWTCTGEPSSCAPVCGDSRIVGGEECDDGNTRDGDCCDATCHFESPGSPCLDEGDPCTVDTCGAAGVCHHDVSLALCPVCGDGLVSGDEDCDDGNAADGDCCDSTCHFEAAGSPCPDEGDVCSSDTCSAGGVCQHEIAPDPGCLAPTVAARARLKIVTPASGNDQVKFTWTKGPAVSKASFGTPAAGIPQYGLCIYDAVGGTPSIVLRAIASGDADCADRVCWSETRSGWKLVNASGAPNGIIALRLVAGAIAGKSKVQAKLKGAFLAAPSLPLTSDPSVVVQVRSSDHQCYGAVFSMPTANDARRYRAKSD
jgi:uncharacterized delta-60 repeat protein